jgi:two-component system sensor histidine kinase DesK
MVNRRTQTGERVASEALVGRFPARSRWTHGRPGLLLRLVPLMLVLPPLVAFLMARPSDERLISLVPAVAGFAAIVVWALAASRPSLPRRALVASVLLSLLAAVVVVADPRGVWLTLFYYPAVAAGLVGPARQTVIAIGGVALAAGATGWWVVGDPASAVEFVLECALFGFGALAVSRLVATNRELATARAEVARLAAADERSRIARDLHDLLGHGLSLIALKAELAGRLLPGDPRRAVGEVRDIESVSRRALEDVRAAVSGYRRVTLESELGGATAVLQAAGIEVEIDQRAGELPDELDEALAWAVREGVTNVIRHGNARRTTVRIRREATEVQLEIVNDGRGDGAWPGSRSEATRGGTGLAGLAERVAAIGGRLEAGPGSEEGYRLAVVLPVPEAGA